MQCSFRDAESGREFAVTLTQRDGGGMDAEDVKNSRAAVEAFQID